MANLPYGVAATVLLKSIAELPGARLWVAMVQREVGERLAAGPGSKAYGATSVLAQLACEVRVLRKRAAHGLPPGAERRVGARAAAPSRPGAAARAGRARPRGVRPPPQGAGRLARARARRARRASATRRAPRSSELGHPPDARAERLAPEDWPRLADAIGRERLAALRPAMTARVGDERAYAKLNLVLHVGRPRADGLHPLCSIFASIDLADEVDVEAGRRGRGRVPGRRGPESRRGRARGLPRRGVPELPPLRVRIEKRIPVAAGLGGGSADAAAVLRAANRDRRRPARPRRAARARARLGSDVPSQVEPRHALVAGVGELVEPVELPALALVLVPQREGLSTARRVRGVRPPRAAGATELDPDATARARRDGPPAALRGARERPPARRALPAARAATRTLASLETAGALGARVSGSGPTCFGLFEDRGGAEAAAAGIEGAIPPSCASERPACPRVVACPPARSSPPSSPC